MKNSYYTYMIKLVSNKAKEWNYPSTDAALLEMLNNNTYNYKAMYDKYGSSDTRHEGHFSDEFKTAYHPTFSTESMYSGKRSQFNHTGIKGGVWVKPYQDHRGNTQYKQYCIGDRMWSPGFNLQKTRNYLNNAEANNVIILPGYPKFDIGTDDNNIGGELAAKLGAGEIMQEVGNFLGQMTPIYGSYLDIKNAYENPSWGNIGTAALTTAGDVLTFGTVSALAKLALKGRKLQKLAKRANAMALSGNKNLMNAADVAAVRIADNKAKQEAVRRIKNNIGLNIGIHLSDGEDFIQRAKKNIT